MPRLSFLLPAILAASAATAPARAADPAIPPLPEQVAALAGCWKGIGTMGAHRVNVRLAVAPVALDAAMAFDLSTAVAENPLDRYAAHLLIGGDALVPTKLAASWTDSFGMAFAALGEGRTLSGGFDVTIFYPTDNVLHRWRYFADELAWSQVAMPRDGAPASAAAEKHLADYVLSRVPCPGAAPPPPPAKAGRRSRVTKSAVPPAD